MNKLKKHTDIRKQKSQKNTWKNIQINLFTVATSEEGSLSPYNLHIYIFLLDYLMMWLHVCITLYN